MNENLPTSATVSPQVPTPNYASTLPREMRLPPRGVGSGPVTRRFPRVIAGVCEFCGILDRNQPGEFQYKLCPHYRGMSMKCVYCDGSRNQDDVIKGDTLNVAEHPDRPGELVVWCKSFECSEAHLNRFKTTIR